MIGGDRNDDGIATATECVVGADRGELLGDQKPILAIGDDNRATEQCRIKYAANGFLEGRQRTKQWQELFWPVFAGRRP